MCVSKCHVLDVSSFSRTWQPWIFNTKISQCTAKPLGKIVESTRTETSTSHVCRPCPSEAAPRQGPSPKELLGNKVGLDGFGWAWMGLDGFGGENFLMGSNPSETYECLGFIIPNWKDKNTLKKNIFIVAGQGSNLPTWLFPTSSLSDSWCKKTRKYGGWKSYEILHQLIQ